MADTKVKYIYKVITIPSEFTLGGSQLVPEEWEPYGVFPKDAQGFYLLLRIRKDQQ